MPGNISTMLCLSRCSLLWPRMLVLFNLKFMRCCASLLLWLMALFFIRMTRPVQLMLRDSFATVLTMLQLWRMEV